jgi:peptidoglycan/xylan/chitin deacetylase (PgdA/CDA1 family)
MNKILLVLVCMFSIVPVEARRLFRDPYNVGIKPINDTGKIYLGYGSGNITGMNETILTDFSEDTTTYSGPYTRWSKYSGAYNLEYDSVNTFPDYSVKKLRLRGVNNSATASAILKFTTTKKFPSAKYIRIMGYVDRKQGLTTTDMSLYLYPDAGNTSNYKKLSALDYSIKRCGVYPDSGAGRFDMAVPMALFTTGGTATWDSIQKVYVSMRTITGDSAKVTFCKLSYFTPPPKKTNVIITVDDAFRGFDSIGIPKLNEYGYKVTFFADHWDVTHPGVGGTSGPDSGRVTSARLVQYQDSGHMIANHSYDHPRYQTITDAQINTDQDSVNSWLGNLGLGKFLRFFAWPAGMHNQRTDSLMAKRVDFARGISDYPKRVQSSPMVNTYGLTGCYPSQTSPTYTQDELHNAVLDSSDIIITFHNIRTPANLATQIPDTVFNRIIDTLRAMELRGIVRVTTPREIWYAPDSLIIKKTRDSTETSITVHDSLSWDADTAIVYWYDSLAGAWTLHDSTSWARGASLFSMTRSGLFPATKYYFRLIAKNYSGMFDSLYTTDSAWTAPMISIDSARSTHGDTADVGNSVTVYGKNFGTSGTFQIGVTPITLTEWTNTYFIFNMPNLEVPPKWLDFIIYDQDTFAILQNALYYSSWQTGLPDSFSIDSTTMTITARNPQVLGTYEIMGYGENSNGGMWDTVSVTVGTGGKAGDFSFPGVIIIGVGLIGIGWMGRKKIFSIGRK